MGGSKILAALPLEQALSYFRAGGFHPPAALTCTQPDLFSDQGLFEMKDIAPSRTLELAVL